MIRVTLIPTVFCSVLLLTTAPAHACSKGTFPASVGNSQAFFTGRATADTLLAGPGAVSYHSGGGSGEQADRDAIYGQRVRVDRLGGPAARGLSRSVREVVVVPWGYDASCQPLAWHRSALWVPPGTHSFYIANLRAPEHWVDGTPTFDLHNPYHLPYTGTERIREMGRDTAVSTLMSPGQVFDFYQALPSAEEVATSTATALGDLQRWVQANPDLAQRVPAVMLIERVVGMVARAELRDVDHAVLGTWRFRFRLGGDTTHIVYARTAAYPTTRWGPPQPPAESDPEQLQIPPAYGYAIMVAISPDLDDLPETVAARDYKQAYIYARVRPDSLEEGRVEWRGWLEESLLFQASPDDPVLRRRIREATERFRPLGIPARFMRGADGMLRLRQVVLPSTGGELLVEGEQISREVIRNRPRPSGARSPADPPR